MYGARLSRIVACGGAIALAACAKTETPPTDSAAAADPAAAAAPNMVTFTAKEYAFEGPDTIPAGLTMFHLNAAGQQLHHLQLIKLEEGKTYADFLASLKVQGPPPTWAVPYGGVNPPAPGGMSIATETMEPGNYAVVCYVDIPDKVPHIAKGMTKSLTVTEAPNANMTEPTAAVTMTLNDYSFTMSKPLAAGRQTIKVENAAAQPHEVVLLKLNPGKTVNDLAAWGKDFKGELPATPLGGIPALAKGKNAFFDANLEPGDYVLICFVPDAKDNKPHFEHGMVQPFKVS
jgi:hypothetical protein